jgi:hypothetical protein
MTAPTMKNAPKEWKNMDDFSAGIDGNRLPATKDLAGSKFVFNDDEKCEKIIFDLAADECSWSFKGESGTSPYEAINVQQDTYFIDFVIDKKQGRTLTLIVNTKTYRAVVINVYMLLENLKPGETMVQWDYYVGTIEGGEATGIVPHFSRDLIGEHAVYQYSPNHFYEHLYINSERFLWHCLHGEQKGHGAAEYAKVMKFQENNYILTWRELLIPTGTCFFLDFTPGVYRSTGKFVGMHKDGTIANDPGGAHIQQIAKIYYPKPFSPI